MSAPWSDFELQCLYDVVNDIHWFDQVRPLLPDRTPGAIRTKMAALREEAEIAPKRSLNAADRAQMRSVAGSQRLADAINELREREAA